MNVFIGLLPHCKIVRGYNRDVICDVLNGKIFLISSGLCEILTNHINISIDKIKKKYNNEFDATIDEYVEFLIFNKIIFLSNKKPNFSELSSEWDFPGKITNSIIEFENCKNVNIVKIIDELNLLQCQFVEFRIFGTIDNEQFENLISSFEHSSVRGLYILLENGEKLFDGDFFLKKYSRLMNIVYFSSQEEKTLVLDYKVCKTTKDTLKSNKCGLISKNYFAINLDAYNESLHFNSCINRKISIDKDGNIKNCPSMSQSFGNIKDTTLEEALNHKDFKKYWNVNKDMIAVCKDCEFRHICTDCRAYTEQTDFEDDIELSKPLKCGYNPYTNVWEEWSTNPLKQKAIEYYGMQDLVKKNE